MTTLIKNGTILYQNKLQKLDILIVNNKIAKISKNITTKSAKVIDASNLVVTPGLIDIHTHLREPGYEYKETVKTGSMAAAAGGFTTICCMPNTKPIIDSLEHLKQLQKIIEHDAVINVLPYASITLQQVQTKLTNIPLLSKKCFAFSDDGVGVENKDLLRQALTIAKKYHKYIVCHCEDTSQIGAAKEYCEVKRDLELAKQTHGNLHLCHISAKESVALIRKYKKHIKVSCEVTPHHLLLNDTIIKRNGDYKMNPPIGSIDDQKSLIKAIKDGTIDIVACDHAPHSEQEKSKGWDKSLNGVVGLETSFALLYTYLVKRKIISFVKLMNLMSSNPAKLFNIDGGRVAVGATANLAIFDLNKQWIIDANNFISKGKSTPFNNMKVYGITKYTICNGIVAYEK